MDKIFTEENGRYQIDCTKAIWATDQLNEYYHAAHCELSDVDWVMETATKIYFVEYKNANIPGAQNPSAFRPEGDKMISKVVRKFYDSLHYLTLQEKTKPKEYVYILEYPNGDSVSRRAIRNRLKEKLPFTLQETAVHGKKLIENVSVVSIDEWNRNSEYGKFAISQV